MNPDYKYAWLAHRSRPTFDSVRALVEALRQARDRDAAQALLDDSFALLMYKDERLIINASVGQLACLLEVLDRNIECLYYAGLYLEKIPDNRPVRISATYAAIKCSQSHDAFQHIQSYARGLSSRKNPGFIAIQIAYCLKFSQHHTLRNLLIEFTELGPSELSERSLVLEGALRLGDPALLWKIWHALGSRGGLAWTQHQDSPLRSLMRELLLMTLRRRAQ